MFGFSSWCYTPTRTYIYIHCVSFLKREILSSQEEARGKLDFDHHFAFSTFKNSPEEMNFFP